MATVTFTSLANQAALRMGGADPGEGLTSTQLTILFQETNQMLASWSIDQRYILSLLVTSNLTLTSGILSYAIGSGGTFDIERPAAIISATAFISTAAAAAYTATGDPQYAEGAAGSLMAVPLKILTAEEFAAFPNRGLHQVFPKGLFYDRQNNSGLGNVFIVPVTLGGTLEIETWSPLPQFVDQTTPLTLPDPAYAKLIEYGMALESTILFTGVEIPSWVKIGFDDADTRVKALNAQLVGETAMQPAAAPQAAAQQAQG